MSEPLATSDETETQEAASAIYSLYKKQYEGALIHFVCCFSDGTGAYSVVKSKNITCHDLTSMIAELHRLVREIE